MSAHYNEGLELFTFDSLPFPELHAQHLTISQLVALERRRPPDYFFRTIVFRLRGATNTDTGVISSLLNAL